MWAINSMFGTGTRGFAIITTVISCGTYAVVFGLLQQPPYQFPAALSSKALLLAPLSKWSQDILNSLKRTIQGNSQNGKPRTAPNAKKGKKIEKDQGHSPNIHMAMASASKGKGKETTTDEEVPDSGPQVAAKGTSSIINRFRRAKGPEHESV